MAMKVVIIFLVVVESATLVVEESAARRRGVNGKEGKQASSWKDSVFLMEVTDEDLAFWSRQLRNSELSLSMSMSTTPVPSSDTIDEEEKPDMSYQVPEKWSMGQAAGPETVSEPATNKEEPEEIKGSSARGSSNAEGGEEMKPISKDSHPSGESASVAGASVSKSLVAAKDASPATKQLSTMTLSSALAGGLYVSIPLVIMF
eukprot:CAMPEP_0113554608 /NCGR_PEP_ID=MMETSP0015_2-20120614/16248_1 /TAXON_ID=2838 /ORGANISM="Odontella" /LENGTH=202 /DNA_ID=CAMNT_0000455777 /DNA_START=14 /DNA_END=622 /DNA_ORIENTATION=- /assembly_acc=CAM_ASM_000160